MTIPSLSACLRRTAEPPIPLARTWADAYTGAAGPPIDLTQAVPGYPPHPELLARMAEAAGQVWSASYGAIEGDAGLRESLAADITRCYAAPVGAADVAITAGCNLAFAMASMALAAPGETVLLPAPWYFNHAMALDMRGVVARPLPCRAEDGFVPDPDRAAALIDETVRAIVLDQPEQPDRGDLSARGDRRLRRALPRPRAVAAGGRDLPRLPPRHDRARTACSPTLPGAISLSISIPSPRPIAFPNIGSARWWRGWRSGPN